MSIAIRLALCSAISALGLVSATAAEDQKPVIKGGIEGKVVKLDAEKGSLTVSVEGGRDRTFSVTEETTIMGPRGGLVHKRLKDPRFHAGLPITVVATGATATQLHLGFDRKARGAKTANSQSTDRQPAGTETPSTVPGQTRRTARFRPSQTEKTPAKETATKDEADDEDNEYPGKVKSVDPARRMLVVTLLNGKDRSFLLASDVKVMVRGRASKLGLGDAAIKPGIPLTVITEAGGRKVKEVKVSPIVSRTTRKAG